MTKSPPNGRGLAHFAMPGEQNVPVPLGSPGSEGPSARSPRSATMLDRIRSALGRITSSGRFIPTVDGLRFVAILSVVLYHLDDYLLHKSSAFSAAEAKDSLLHRILACGGCGVPLFFVISGFILGLPFAEHYLVGRRKPSLGQYFKRRVLRIEPPYVINMLLVFALLVMVKGSSASSLFPNLLASLFYVHGAVFHEMSQINFVAWSLEIEIQFYILAPFLALVFVLGGARLRRAAILGAILLLIGLKTAAPAFWQQHFGMTVVYFLEYFMAGFLLVDFYIVSWNENPSRTFAWDAIALVAWCSVAAVQFHDLTRNFLPLAILAAYAATFRGRIAQQIFTQRWLVTIGGMCYTIYLYHFYVISAVGRWTTGLSIGHGYVPNVLLQMALILPWVLAVSIILFLLCEKPFMVRDWPARWMSAVRAAWQNRRMPRNPTPAVPVLAAAPLETPAFDAAAGEATTPLAPCGRGAGGEG